MPDDAPDEPLRPGALREVVVGPVAHGGHFIAHSDGRTLFVRHALPGERVRVRITDVTSKLVRADAVEILVASPDRIPAPCRWAGPEGCGGCDFQHAALPAQRVLKTQVLRDALVRFGRVPPDSPLLQVEVEPLPGRDDGLRWRTRMTWATGADGTVGLHPHRSHEVLAIDDCLIAAQDVSRPTVPVPARAVRSVRGRTWRISHDGFWQVHPGLADALVDTVLAFAQPQPGQTWWDLYSGAGLFAAFLGEVVGEEGAVQAVESHGEAVRAGRRALHDLPQVRLVEADVRSWVQDGNPSGHLAGVVLDPPREGAGAQVVKALARQRPDVIVYVACDPVALGRDVALLAEAGFRLDALRAFDAFPMTHHFESVARLLPSR